MMRNAVLSSTRKLSQSGRTVGHMALTPYKFEIITVIHKVENMKNTADEVCVIMERRDKLQFTPCVSVKNKCATFEHPLKMDATLFRKGGSGAEDVPGSASPRAGTTILPAEFQEKMCKLAVRLKEPNGTSLGKIHLNLAEYVQMPSGSVKATLKLNNGSNLIVTFKTKYLSTGKKPGLLGSLSSKGAGDSGSMHSGISAYSRGTGGFGREDSSIGGDDFLDDLDDLDDLIEEEESKQKAEEGEDDDFNDLEDIPAPAPNTMGATKEKAKQPPLTEATPHTFTFSPRSQKKISINESANEVASIKPSPMNPEASNQPSFRNTNISSGSNVLASSKFAKDAVPAGKTAPTPTGAAAATTTATASGPMSFPRTFTPTGQQTPSTAKDQSLSRTLTSDAGKTVAELEGEREILFRKIKQTEKSMEANEEKLDKAKERYGKAKEEYERLQAKSGGVSSREARERKLRAMISEAKDLNKELYDEHDELEQQIRTIQDRADFSKNRNLSARFLKRQLEDLQVQVQREPNLADVQGELVRVKKALVQVNQEKAEISLRSARLGS